MGRAQIYLYDAVGSEADRLLQGEGSGSAPHPFAEVGNVRLQDVEYAIRPRLERVRSGNSEFIRFLNAVEAAVPSDKVIHAILDNVATHKHPKVRAWLARHPRWTFHFTPTSASWLNAVEGFFSALTRRRLRRGSFTGVVDLQAAIKRHIAEHNRRARPFV